MPGLLNISMPKNLLFDRLQFSDLIIAQTIIYVSDYEPINIYYFNMTSIIMKNVSSTNFSPNLFIYALNFFSYFFAEKICFILIDMDQSEQIKYFNFFSLY